MFKKGNCTLLIALLLLTSCESIRSGLMGTKKKNTDEFLVKKKDPLILPPDYKNLPTPDERIAVTEEISTFERTLEAAIEDNSSSSSSTEDSILKKIQSK